MMGPRQEAQPLDKCFILIVAAFNIMASLTMLLLDKKKDLEALDALGMPVHMMEQAFGLQGLTINVIGGLVGVGLGSLLVMGQAAFGWLLGLFGYCTMIRMMS